MPVTELLIEYLRRERMTYAEYLASDHWQEVKRRYRDSKMPHRCLVCGIEQYELHHITYQRLGQEDVGDTVPLCREHHQSLHEYEKVHGIHRIRTVFVRCFKMVREDAILKLYRFNCDRIKGQKLGKPVSEKKIPKLVWRDKNRRKKEAKAAMRAKA